MAALMITMAASWGHIQSEISKIQGKRQTEKQGRENVSSSLALLDLPRNSVVLMEAFPPGLSFPSSFTRPEGLSLPKFHPFIGYCHLPPFNISHMWSHLLWEHKLLYKISISALCNTKWIRGSPHSNHKKKNALSSFVGVLKSDVDFSSPWAVARFLD